MTEEDRRAANKLADFIALAMGYALDESTSAESRRAAEQIISRAEKQAAMMFVKMFCYEDFAGTVSKYEKSRHEGTNFTAGK